MYHALGYGVFEFLEAVLTFEQVRYRHKGPISNEQLILSNFLTWWIAKIYANGVKTVFSQLRIA